MFGLSAANSAFLYALAAVAVPIIIHFLFSSIEFILTSTVLKSSRIKFKELILLLLRVAAVALITLAFVRPFLRRDLSAFGLAGRTDLVVLLDDSYSMQYREARATRFAAAVRHAQDTIAQCRGGDRVAIVLATQTRAPALKLTPNFRTARALLGDLQPSFRTGLLADGLDRAVQLLKGSSADNKVVFVVSDFQQATWGYVANVQAKLPADVKIKARAIGQGEARNLAVLEFRSARDGFTPGEKVAVLARVANYADTLAQGVRATLYVEGQPTAEKTLSLKPREVREAAFQFTAPDLPSLVCEVRLKPEDPLMADNQGHCALEQGRPLRVLCVEDKVADVAYFQESLYLRTALDPTAENLKSISRVRAELIDSLELEKAGVFGYDAVVLADLPGLTESQAEHLEKFVRSGGGLLVFLGPHVEPAIYNKLLFKQGNGVLPARLVDMVATLGKGQEYFHLDKLDMAHPVFEVFSKPFSGDLTTPRFSGAFKVDATPCAEAKALAHFDNGLLAVIEREFGLGKCVLITSTAGTAWTNLPKRMVYVPLVHQLVKCVSPRQAAELPKFAVAEPVPVPRDLLAHATSLTVKRPDGKEHQVQVEREKPTVFYRADLPGIYDVTAIVGESGRRVPIWRFAAGLSTIESDLSPASPRRVADLSKRSATQAVAVEEAVEIEARDGDLPPSLWRYLFLAALACMAVELFIANRND